MDLTEAQEAKQLRDENTRLRKLVADLSLDKEALQSVIRKNGGSPSDEGSCRACRTAVRIQSAVSVQASHGRSIELPYQALSSDEDLRTSLV